MFEGMVIGDAPRRRARDVHGAQGVVRPGRRAHLPAALADHRQDRSAARREGPPRQALLPARPEGQGRAHEGTEEAPERLAAPRVMAKVRASRTDRERHPADGVRRTSRAWTRSGAAAWPGRSWRRPSCSTRIATSPGSATRRRSRRSSASASTTRSRAAPSAWAVAACRVATKSIASTSIRRRCGRCSRPCWRWCRARTSCSSTGSAFPDLLMAQRAVDPRRRPVHGDRGGVDPRQSHARPADAGAARPRSRATGSTATRATRPATTSTRSRSSATRTCTGGRSGRHRCLIGWTEARPVPVRRRRRDGHSRGGDSRWPSTVMAR